MEVQDSLVEFAPNLLGGIGPRGIGGQWDECDLGPYQSRQDVIVKVNRPVVLNDQDDFGFTVECFQCLIVADQSPAVERFALPLEEPTGQGIQTTRNTVVRVVARATMRMRSIAACQGVALSNRWMAIVDPPAASGCA